VSGRARSWAGVTVSQAIGYLRVSTREQGRWGLAEQRRRRHGQPWALRARERRARAVVLMTNANCVPYPTGLPLAQSPATLSAVQGEVVLPATCVVEGRLFSRARARLPRRLPNSARLVTVVSLLANRDASVTRKTGELCGVHF